MVTPHQSDESSSAAASAQEPFAQVAASTMTVVDLTNDTPGVPNRRLVEVKSQGAGQTLVNQIVAICWFGFVFLFFPDLFIFPNFLMNEDGSRTQTTTPQPLASLSQVINILFPVLSACI